jgi:hypothetical protein
MTAITLKVNEAVAQKFETFAQTRGLEPEAAFELLLEKEDTTAGAYHLYETDEPIPEAFLGDVLEGWAQATRKEGIPADEYFAMRREERKKRNGVSTSA